MVDPETLRAFKIDPSILERLDDLIARKEPKKSRFHIPVPPQAMLLIGYIVAQWGNLQSIIKRETEFRGRANVPAAVLSKDGLEIKRKIEYLRAAAPYFLDGKRAEALPVYLRNLNQITNHQFTRDAIAHGSYAAQDNEGVEGVVVQYKSRKLRLSYARMQQLGDELGGSTAFFFTFWEWVEATPDGRAAAVSFLEWLLELERARQETKGD